MHQWNFWPFFQNGPVIQIWILKQNCKIAYVLALPEDICAKLMKYVIHILKAFDISYWKMQEKVKIITNWTILDKNTQKRILWAIEFDASANLKFNLVQIIALLESSKSIISPGICAQKRQNFCRKWKYWKNIQADHNLNWLYYFIYCSCYLLGLTFMKNGDRIDCIFRC